jgi:p21-activated kinase 1
MRFSSRDETCDTNTPSSPSSRPSVNGGIRRKSSNETIQSYQGSISNSSVHTISTAESSDTHKDLSDLSGPRSPPAVSHHSSESSTGQYPSIFDYKTFHSLEKPTSFFRNESLSTICTTREPNSDNESDSGSTSPSPSTPKQEPSSLGLPTLEDVAEIYLPPTPRSPQAIVPTRVEAPSPSTSTGPSPVLTAPPPPLNDPLMKSYGDSQPFATTEISTADTPSIRPTPFIPPPTDRIGTRSRNRSSSTVTFKEKKGILGFMNGLRKSIDFCDSNKRLEVSAPYYPVHVQHVGFDSITGKLTILPGKRQEFFQDNRISKHDQERDSLATIEFSHGNNWETMRYDALKVPRPPLPRFPGMAPTANPEVSKPVDDGLTSTGLRVPRFPRPLSDSSKLLPLPKTAHSRAHSSGGSQVVSTTPPPASYRPFPPPPPARLNLDFFNSQQALPKPPRNDTLVRGNATGDWRTPEPQASVKATPTTSPVTERRAQPTTALQQQSPVAASLAKSAGATPRRREKNKQNKANDTALVKRLQGICKVADPTRLYRNLVKIGHG